MRNYQRESQFVEWMRLVAERIDDVKEGEVETKFIIPLFENLGYPVGCRADKYYVRGPEKYSDTVNPSEKAVSKNYADFVYFSTDQQNQQSPETALIVVEAKRSSERNLDKHLPQARKYGNLLLPLFLFVTNGKKIKVLMRHQFTEEEVLFDHELTEFKSADLCREFYLKLNFETTCRIKRKF